MAVTGCRSPLAVRCARALFHHIFSRALVATHAACNRPAGASPIFSNYFERPCSLPLGRPPAGYSTSAHACKAHACKANPDPAPDPNQVVLNVNVYMQNTGNYEWTLHCVLRACGSKTLSSIFKQADPFYKVQFLAKRAVQYNHADISMITIVPRWA